MIADIKAHAEALAIDESAVLAKLKKSLVRQDAQQLVATRGEIARLRRRVHELEQQTAKLYEDKVTGVIRAKTFTMLMQKNEQERQQQVLRLDELQSQVGRYEQDETNTQMWAVCIRKHLDMDDLDREIIDELIDHIVIGERSVIDGVRHQDIRICYRFVGIVG